MSSQDSRINLIASYIQDGVTSVADLMALGTYTGCNHAETDEALTILAAERFCTVQGDRICR